jgi:hypothetical protein
MARENSFSYKTVVDLPPLKKNQAELNRIAMRFATPFMQSRDRLRASSLTARSLRSLNTVSGVKAHLETNQQFIGAVSDHVLQDY